MVAPVRVVKNRRVLDRLIQISYDQMCQEYGEALDRSFFQYRKWGGKFGTTYRRSGEKVPAGRTRDTVDLSNLWKARKFLKPGRLTTNVTYPIAYAKDVFDGYITELGTVVPARPLPKIVAGEFKWGDNFRRKWKEQNYNGYTGK